MQASTVNPCDSDKGRINYIDGLRGLAALIVLNNHTASLFDLYTLIEKASDTFPLVRYLHAPIQFLLNGQFSVVLFFILSGYLVGNRFYSSENKQRTLLSTGIRRYFTLVLPCAVSILIGYLIVRFSLTRAHLLNPNYRFWLFEPNLSEAIYNGFWGIFAGEELPYSYNISLWTIKYELSGTFLVMALLGIFGGFAKRHLIYTGVLLFLITKDAYHCYHICFVVGLMMIDFEKNGKPIPQWLRHPLAHAAILVTGVLITIYPVHNYKPFNIICRITDHAGLIFLVLGVAMFFYVITRSEWLQKLLNAKILRKIGKISFSVYVSHLFVLGTISSYIFLAVNQYISYNWSRMIAFLCSYIAVFLIGMLVHKSVNLPGIKMAQYIEKKLTKQS
ncbi:MAG: acyltransferase [Clostridia bacterium]|nr:acyltransferase [Clostridia bacterium]